MAGLGLGPSDFALFEIDEPDARAGALEAHLQPKLLAMADTCRSGLARVAGRDVHVHAAKVEWKRDEPPEEVCALLVDDTRGIRGVPALALVATRDHLHLRICVRGDSPRRAALQAALVRDAVSLAKKGKPFRRLRAYQEWNHEELPELAPAHSPAFWTELAAELAPGRGGLEVGIAFTQEEARSLSLGDLLGVFRDLAPLYKLLASADEGAS
jgi:uncharacterized protein YktB (UPF0637 family)